MNAHGRKGWTPLNYAASRADFERMSLLVQHGADMHALTSDGNMPIHIAARDGGQTGVADCIIFGA